MNNDDNFIRNSGDLSSELEARVVAWVLGEASAFEAAQLEMLCAEQPELAVFKRRIEAVHGLMGEAAKPMKAPLRLSPERRAKVLAVIGGEESVAGVPAGQAQPSPARPAVRPLKYSKLLDWRSWALPVAACLTMMVLLSAVLIPTVGKVQQRARRTAEFVDQRQQEQMRLMEQPVTSAEVVDNSLSSREAPMVFFDKDKASASQMMAANPPVPSAPVPSTAPMQASRDDGGIANTTVGGATGSPSTLSLSGQNQFTGGFASTVTAGKTETAVAAKPTSKRQTVAITAGTLQEFAELASNETPQLGDQRQAWAMNNDLAGAKQAGVGGDEQSKARLEAVAADVRRRREIRDPAVDPFAPADKFDGETSSGIAGKDLNQADGSDLLVKAQNRLKAGDTAGARQALDLYASSSSTGAHRGAGSGAFGLNNELAGAASSAAEGRNEAKLAAKGRSQYLAGDLSGAQETFKTLEAAAPENKEANVFLARIEKEKSTLAELNRVKARAQMVEEVSNSWQRPGVSVNASKQKSEADAKVLERLDQIMVPSINLQGVELSKAISTLTAVSKDGDSTSPNIILLDSENLNPAVNLTLRNLSLRKTLDFMTESVGYAYEVKGDTIVVRPRTDVPEVVDAVIPLHRSVLERIVGRDVAPGGETMALREFMQSAGVKFDGVARSNISYDGAAVIVSQSPRNIERLRKILERYREVPKAPDAPDIEKLRSEIPTATEAISTFSLHVSDASFRLAKAALERGQAPDPATIRPEEFYNAFDYGDPSPAAGEAVNCRVEQSAHPFLQQRNLVRIAMKVPASGRGSGTPLRLTVLLDTSGSMEREDRAATVRAALTALTSLLGPNDRVTLIGFARTPRLLAESVPGDQAGKLVELAARTPSEGGTNLEEALALAGKLAMRQKLAAAQNRIVVLSDGAANLGDADPQALAKRVEALRQNGIAFDACGVVADGLDDSVLEALTRKGDGRYAVLNSPEEADASFARQLAGAFRPAAKDVKVQVHFNPARVARYRLIGFEQHRLKTEDFRNDAVDAAELAAEEAAVALYQVEVLPEGEGELGEVSVRFLDTGSGQRVERTWTLGYAAQVPAFARATPSLQLAGASAFLAEKLRGGALAGQVRLEEFAPVVEGLGAAYPQAERVKEFITMFRQTRRLTGE